MRFMQEVKDGYISFKGYKIFYRIFGKASSQKHPLLILHGGPGSMHNYLLGLSGLAGERQIIFYDQLGCGKSDIPTDKSIYHIPLFVEELATIRKALKLSKVHILGHSWGGMLAIEYLLTEPKGVVSTILASSMISLPLYQDEVEKLKRALPGNIYKIMKTHEAESTTLSKQYVKAYAVYRLHHLYNGGKLPKKYVSADGIKGDAVYKKLWGVSEAYANGELKKWDRINDLHKLNIPILITSGQHDELTPRQANITHDHIPNSQIKIFSNGTHLVHIEQEKLYLQAVSDFLASTEK